MVKRGGCGRDGDGKGCAESPETSFRTRNQCSYNAGVGSGSARQMEGKWQMPLGWGINARVRAVSVRYGMERSRLLGLRLWAETETVDAAGANPAGPTRGYGQLPIAARRGEQLRALYFGACNSAAYSIQRHPHTAEYIPVRGTATVQFACSAATTAHCCLRRLTTAAVAPFFACRIAQQRAWH